NLPSEHYRPESWNTLKVRIEEKKILCYVNDQKLIESEDDGLSGGKVGLASFRGTAAEFKQFQVADKIASRKVPDDVAARVRKLLDTLPADKAMSNLVDKLTSEDPATLALLRERAKLLEEQAAQLRKLAHTVHP